MEQDVNQKLQQSRGAVVDGFPIPYPGAAPCLGLQLHLKEKMLKWAWL